jgi:hypothetical protein
LASGAYRETRGSDIAAERIVAGTPAALNGQAKSMKAIVQDQYGSADVLQLRDIDKPEVGLDDLLLRVHAAGVHIGDWHLMSGEPYLRRIIASASAGQRHVFGVWMSRARWRRSART